MKHALVVAFLMALAGCAEPSVVAEQGGENFDDLGVSADDQHGVILGVVVDQSIQPIAGVDVMLPSEGRSTVTDSQGRFVFDLLLPGTYFLEVSKLGHTSTQASATVEAGNSQPPVVKVQIERLIDADPYLNTSQFNGYFTCAFSAFVSSSCVNDYSRLCNPNQAPVCCAGGCFGDEIRGLGLDEREYITELPGNWSTVQVEWIWEPSLAGTAQTMGVTVHYAARPSTSTYWISDSGESPMLTRMEAGQRGPGGNEDPPNGDPVPDLFIFWSTGSGVAVEQSWESFRSDSFYAPIPSGWSFIAGDQNPF